MHLTTVLASLAAIATTSAAPLQARQEPYPLQLHIRTYGNDRCANQNFNGLSISYTVLRDDIGKCRTFYQDKMYPVGSISAEFDEQATNTDSCALAVFSDLECKMMEDHHVRIGSCTPNLIAEDVCPRSMGPKSFIYNC